MRGIQFEPSDYIADQVFDYEVALHVVVRQPDGTP